MDHLSLILDVGAAAILIIFTILGAHRGFIKTVSGLLTVVIAYYGAGFLARMLGPWAAEQLMPYLENIQLPEILSAETLEQFSFAGVAVGSIDSVQEALGGTVSRVTESIISGIAQALGYALVAAVSFVVLCIICKLIFHAIDLVARLPLLDLTNHVLGFAAGVATGVVLLLAIAWILGFFDAYITAEVVQDTHIYKWFADLPGTLQSLR